MWTAELNTNIFVFEFELFFKPNTENLLPRG